MSDKIKQEFGNKLKQARLSRGWTQEELAEKSDLHFTYVGQAERGLRNVTILTIHKLAKALKIKGGDLLPF